ncbi:DUF2235 domain-containing protein [Mycolicibacterium sp. 018/SC-01/001]|nr:DUF2235 domain-containing protein [Mycolicibacterium sp. 018/SC-01/001]
MKNIALCFDNFNSAGNAAVVAGMLRRSAGQLVWSSRDVGPAPPDVRRPVRREGPLDAARRLIAAAYDVLADSWEPGDRVFVFGSCRDAACARALARLVGTVGVLPAGDTDGPLTELRGYLLGTYGMSRTARDPQDWERLARTITELRGCDEAQPTIRFLGLWETRGVTGVPRAAIAGTPPRVEIARHALAIDGRTAAIPLDGDAATQQDVWFRGGHGDISRARHSCAALSDLALDWVVDGAVRAGVELAEPAGRQALSPVDALAGSAHPVSPRRLPVDAAVHASVECYLRAHPSYWRRLPARVEWADPEWLARGERLIPSPKITQTPAALPTLVDAS